MHYSKNSKESLFSQFIFAFLFIGALLLLLLSIVQNLSVPNSLSYLFDSFLGGFVFAVVQLSAGFMPNKTLRRLLQVTYCINLIMLIRLKELHFTNDSLDKLDTLTYISLLALPILISGLLVLIFSQTLLLNRRNSNTVD